MEEFESNSLPLWNAETICMNRYYCGIEIDMPPIPIRKPFCVVWRANEKWVDIYILHVLMVFTENRRWDERLHEKKLGFFKHLFFVSNRQENVSLSAFPLFWKHRLPSEHSMHLKNEHFGKYRLRMRYLSIINYRLLESMKNEIGDFFLNFFWLT